MAYAVPKDYTWELKIASYDAGRDRRLRPSNQLKLQQEVGELHLGIGGLDYDAFYQHGMVFVLTRTRTVIHRAPLLDEHVKLRTWHRDSQGAQFFRCYQFLDSGERPLIESVSAFALVDSETHKILRASAFDRFGVDSQTGRFNGCPDPVKLKLPAELVPAGERPVRWSDTDYNRHLNNTVYADILCDYLPGRMEGKRLTEYAISFLREAGEGEVLSIETAQQPVPGGGKCLCAERTPAAPGFEAWARYEEETPAF